MIGTYATVAAVCVSSLAIGQAAILLCGGRRWSWLAPSAGLALLCAVCWGTVRLPGDRAVSAVAVLVLTATAVFYLWGRVEGAGMALTRGWPVALVALLAASLPFAVEGHFGILGTSFNPDMSQHLLTADRLADGHSSQLLNQGYPLGPHSIVVALNKGLGIGLVQGFSGLTLAVAVLACLTALAAFADLPLLPRTAGALLVGLAYVVASYLAQGAFKETMQALFFLAFVLALRESTRAWADLPLRYVPAALIAVGSVYTYSFPGLIWLGGTAVLYPLFSRGWRGRGDHPRGVLGDGGSPAVTGPAGQAAGLAVLTFAVLVLPELGRMIDFRSFETFDPNGPGLGNLFGQISPFEALGIWPSGDFRLAPGDGAVPAVAYYLGIAFALVLFVHGAIQLWRRREAAILSGLGAAALAYAAARLGGTPYTAAKAIEIGAPIVALAILMPLLDRKLFLIPAIRGKGTAQRLLLPSAALFFVLAAAVCSLLALANAPVGPTSYSSTLSEYRRIVGMGPTLIVASPQLLEEEHGGPYLSWELRGGHVCIEDLATWPQPSVRFVITEGEHSQAPFPGVRIVRRDPSYALWGMTGRVRKPLPGRGRCPLIAERQARQGPAR
ncbi:MAG TPA: hypothetical protein VFS64_04930 [Solirubrobacterales bacterium]|nr:hypothetical protein [Solirubrobacterales bacterium]